MSALRVYSDPLQHAAIAAAVVAPLGRNAVRTAVAAALIIDVDHAVAARSVRIRATTGLDTRPRTHSIVTALAASAAVGVLGGRVQGWAAFAGLVSHLLHDAGDQAAPTPMLWPLAPARQLGRKRQAAGTVLLALGSLALSRRAAAAASSSPSAAACADGDGASARPRTA